VQERQYSTYNFPYLNRDIHLSDFLLFVFVRLILNFDDNYCRPCF